MRKDNTNSKLFSYEVQKDKTYKDICDYCFKPFEFTAKDVKDRVVKCPHCGKDMVFFYFKY